MLLLLLLLLLQGSVGSEMHPGLIVKPTDIVIPCSSAESCKWCPRAFCVSSSAYLRVPFLSLALCASGDV
jgi:hypothetical protein